ncbi:putative box H/ACA snoRNP assembly protein Shq1 [Paratrimastix pyriformis]|uniref:Box H/ACA snoRNP assembly protein Shq1 n=1 Tax=Paratrimastix pyriformis TaxID=342808 RepID=A0ABQ8U8T7_9EUKA|nr:putative box H/ACA snoRNP assembly protein Shq1 [Paratrimastix pyriformis]
MLTPLFRCSQNDDFVTVVIRIPYVKVDTMEFYVSGDEFKFYCKPYFLRLIFPHELVEDGREKGVYDWSSGEVTITLPKKNRGEVFPDLDMLTKLLARRKRHPAVPAAIATSTPAAAPPAPGPDASLLDRLHAEVGQQMQSTSPQGGINPLVEMAHAAEDEDDDEQPAEPRRPLIEVISSTDAPEEPKSKPAAEPKKIEELDPATIPGLRIPGVRTADDVPCEEPQGDGDEDEEWEAEQQLPSLTNVEEAARPHYGFNNGYQGCFLHLQEACKEVVDLPDPDQTPASQRTALRLAAEDDKFDGSHFMADLINAEDSNLAELLQWIPPWCAAPVRPTAPTRPPVAPVAPARRPHPGVILCIGCRHNPSGTNHDPSGVIAASAAGDMPVAIQAAQEAIAAEAEAADIPAFDDPDKLQPHKVTAAPTGPQRTAEGMGLEEWSQEVGGPADSRISLLPRSLLQCPDDGWTVHERELLMRLPYKERPLPRRPFLASHGSLIPKSRADLVANPEPLLWGLFDIMFAYCYNQRTTLGENTVESAWTIAKVSPTLSWLEDAVCACIRRALSFPLYRHWDLVQAVLADTVALLRSGRQRVLKVLLELKDIFDRDEARHLLCTIFINDYLMWLQRFGQAEWDRWLDGPDFVDPTHQTDHPLAQLPLPLRPWGTVACPGWRLPALTRRAFEYLGDDAAAARFAGDGDDDDDDGVPSLEQEEDPQEHMRPTRM